MAQIGLYNRNICLTPTSQHPSILFDRNMLVRLQVPHGSTLPFLAVYLKEFVLLFSIEGLQQGKSRPHGAHIPWVPAP